MNSCGNCANDRTRATRRLHHWSDLEVKMEKTVDEVKRLQSCINDLISVLALAAIWSGSESCQIVGTLLEALLAILRLDFACARLNDSIDGSPIEVVRLAQRRNPSAQPQEVARALGRWLSGDQTAPRFVIPNPAGEGEVAIASLPLGLQDEVGVLVAGSRRADFPTEIELLLLRVAANQAAIGLQEARRSGDQKRVAEALERRVAERTSQLTAANEELRRSQAYLAEAQRLSHTGSFGWRVSTGEIIWSEETFRIFQYDRTTIPTKELALQRVHPEDAALVKQTIERAAQDGKDFDHEYRLVMPDGSIKYVHVVAHALSDESDGIEFVGAVMDVTAVKQAEEALRRSESYLAEAQRVTHTGSWAWRVAGRDALHLSEEWYRIYGFDPEEGLSAWEERLQRIHPEDRAKWQEATDRAIGEKSDYEVEVRILLPDGTVKYIHTVGHPVLNASGDVVQFVGSSMDISASRRAEETLRQSEAYLAEAQRLSHTGSWAWTPATGDIRYWSEECYRVLGFDPYGGLPRFETFFQHIHPDDQARTAEKLERAKRERAEFELDYRIVHPGGEIRDIHVVGHPVLTPSGDLVEFVGTVIDVTERKRAEEERERLRQAHADLARVNRVTTMGELTASLAHEVNQPIAAALTNANTCLRWLTRDRPDLEEAREAALRIVKDATRAGGIISRVRLLYKKSTPQHELVDVNEAIREMIVLLRSEVTRYFITVRLELAADIPQIMGDRVQLQQVLMNLVVNSIDAMKEVDGARELAIKSQRTEKEEVLVSVSDTGVGLPPQHADQIFNAFFTWGCLRSRRTRS